MGNIRVEQDQRHEKTERHKDIFRALAVRSDGRSIQRWLAIVVKFISILHVLIIVLALICALYLLVASAIFRATVKLLAIVVIRAIELLVIIHDAVSLLSAMPGRMLLNRL